MSRPQCHSSDWGRRPQRHCRMPKRSRAGRPGRCRRPAPGAGSPRRRAAEPCSAPVATTPPHSSVGARNLSGPWRTGYCSAGIHGVGRRGHPSPGPYTLPSGACSRNRLHRRDVEDAVSAPGEGHTQAAGRRQAARWRSWFTANASRRVRRASPAPMHVRRPRPPHPPSPRPVSGMGQTRCPSTYVFLRPAPDVSVEKLPRGICCRCVTIRVGGLDGRYSAHSMSSISAPRRPARTSRRPTGPKNPPLRRGPDCATYADDVQT
jgi:hypothetical protein